MTDQTKTKLPAPLYAAAGVGDLAVEQLRKLPAVVTELSERAAVALRGYNEQANVKAAQLREKAQTTDFDALRGNAASVATSLAQLAQDRAATAYTFLVSRGERVVGTGIIEAAEVVDADIAATDTAATDIAATPEPKAVEAAQVVEAAQAVEATATPTPKPRKRATKPVTKPAE